MKNHILFLLAILVASLPTCKKNSPPIVDNPGDPTDTIVSPPVDSHIIELGKVFVRRNGLVWNAPFYGMYSHLEGTFLISGTVFYSGVSELFRMDDIPCNPGKYTFEFWPSQASLWPNRIPTGNSGMVYDGDQGIGAYFLDTLRNDHFIEVLRYDSLTHMVEGRFQIFTKKAYPGTWVPSGIFLPDSIAMTDGRFRLELRQ